MIQIANSVLATQQKKYQLITMVKRKKDEEPPDKEKKQRNDDGTDLEHLPRQKASKPRLNPQLLLVPCEHKVCLNSKEKHEHSKHCKLTPCGMVGHTSAAHTKENEDKKGPLFCKTCSSTHHGTKGHDSHIRFTHDTGDTACKKTGHNRGTSALCLYRSLKVPTQKEALEEAIEGDTEMTIVKMALGQ
jgi:hypothetical protein